MLLYGPHSPSYVQWGPVEEAELLGDFWGVGAYRALRGSPNTGDPPTLPHGGRDGGDINGGGAGELRIGVNSCRNGQWGALTGGQRGAQSPQQQEGAQHGGGSGWVLLPGLKYPPWEFLHPPPTPGEGGMGTGRDGGGEWGGRGG